MKCVLVRLVCSICLLLWDVLATYTNTDTLGPALQQSYAQTRLNGRPPLRTLNPAMHRTDFTYRGGYSYHYQPPSPPWMPAPVYLYPPAPHHRPPMIAAVPPFHQHSHPLIKGPPVSLPHHHQYHARAHPHVFKGPAYPKTKGPCPTKAASTVLTSAVVRPPPTVPSTIPPTVLPTTTLATTTSAPTTMTATATPTTTTTTTAPPSTTLPVTSAVMALPVSTQSGLNTTISPVETEVKVKVVEDPCECEAQLAFQKKTQAALQQLTSKIAHVSQKIKILESLAGQG